MNFKKAIAALAILGLAFLGATGATAEYGTIDAVPAATLLLPYFEVDLDGDGVDGVSTLFSINNASSAPTVAHVVIWSDLTVPVLDFNVYLTGYDVQTINLFDIIVAGNLPQTADWDSDNTNTPAVEVGETSPQGSTAAIPDFLSRNSGLEYSSGGAILDPDGWDGSFDDCGDTLPPVPAILLNRLQNGLTGQPTDFDDIATGGARPCIGSDQGDRIARGYVTVDNVTECTVQFPGEAGYFGTSVVSFENQLWGDYAIVDRANAFAFGETLVHIEAGDTTVPGVTFYGRYVDELGTDRREGLPSQHATRYVSGGAFSGGTDLLVWREGRGWNPATDGLPYDCNLGTTDYSWYPLNEAAVVAFNEAEQWEELCEPFEEFSPISPPIDIFDDPVCFPLETQRVSVGVGDLDPSYNFGWMYLNPNPANADNVDMQSWVVTNMNALGLYSVGYDAIQLDNTTGSLQHNGGGGTADAN